MRPSTGDGKLRRHSRGPAGNRAVRPRARRIHGSRRAEAGTVRGGELSRVGGTRTIEIDVRLVAATNRDLARLVEERQFRDDLYYRLNVFPICAPPLRERPEDIESLVRHFVRLFAARIGRRIEFVPAEALEALRRHPW